MSTKTILLDNINMAVDSDGLFHPTDELLDLIWSDAWSSSDNLGLLMSDVINGDGDIDNGLILLAHYGTISCAANLRVVAQELFRKHAYSLAEEFEFNVMEASSGEPNNE